MPGLRGTTLPRLAVLVAVRRTHVSDALRHLGIAWVSYTLGRAHLLHTPGMTELHTADLRSAPHAAMQAGRAVEGCTAVRSQGG